MTKPSRAQRIADLNDKFRKSLVTGGRTYMAAGVNSKGPEFVARALVKVIAFDNFNADNDPHREHDFGSFELKGEKVFWKIDLYERELVKPSWSRASQERYTITFKETPPYIKPGFWQLRMWDGTSCYPIANPINRYVIGSDVDMKKNPDGSVTIYIQADSPGKDKESNWLPSPRGSMIMVISAYAPGPAMVESLSNPNAYVAPPVVAVEGVGGRALK